MAIDQNKYFMHIVQVPKVVIDGGPCAGKTTGIVRVVEELTERGWLPLIIHEIATEFRLSGIWFGDELLDPLRFQECLIRYAMMKEDMWQQIAQHMQHKDPKKVVIICDRGLMSSKAYIEDNEAFLGILANVGLNEIQARDERYRAVIHMETAPEEFYTLANNVARHESWSEASRRSGLILQSWMGHPHLRVVHNNYPSFDAKIVQGLVAEIFEALGEPAPMEKERKFLIELPTNERIAAFNAVELYIQQTYLLSELHQQERVRRRGINNYYLYTHTIKQEVRKGENIELEQMIDSHTYRKMLLNPDPLRRPIEKMRACFVDPYPHQHFYWEIDRYVTKDIIIKPSEALMELECRSLTDDVEFPEGIKVIAEVTGDSRYGNHSMALLN